jgi:non-specific serine/threonine protein kinase/serine/threonine-protein kinase
MNEPRPDRRGGSDLAPESESIAGRTDGPASAREFEADPIEDPVFSTMSFEETAGPPTVVEEGPGAFVGPYKLLDRIGEGGMGIVYMAEQTSPIRRKVAVKIIKPGMDSRQVIARFEAERQALAMMDHPNIARVLDAGSTATGRPYFVMELVKGVPITAFCDEARLAPRERIELLVDVCQAIQHAHQKGIIHRDIKPSNVLVSLYDGRPVPKAIDFGLAKAIDQQLTERTLFTRYGAIVGTLEYMSPEQAENSAVDVDTRTDIYALGVLLYELLTGTTPLERPRLLQGGYSEILRRIREEEPPRLSARISKSEQVAAIASRRGMEPARLARLVRGELDWIAMKALEKDRGRRYATANDLARDLDRYLRGEPVEAGPPSAVYRLRKYAGRHRAALATASAFVAVLVAAAAISIGLAVRATRERERARRSEAEAKATFGFFRDKVLAVVRPEGREKGQGGDVTLRAAINAAEPSITTDFAGQPKVEAAIRDTLGTSYFYFGETKAAIRQLERAMTLRAEVLGPDHDDTRDSMDTLALAYLAAGRFTEAVALHQEVYGVSLARLGPEHPATLRTMSNLATAYVEAGRADEAVPLADRVLAVREAKLGPDHPDTLTAINNLAKAYWAVDRHDDALRMWVSLVERSRRILGPEHPDTLTRINNLASEYVRAGRSAAAPLFEEVLRVRRRKLDPDHPDTLLSMSNLAAAELAAGRFEKSIALYEEILAARQAKLGPEHPDVAKTVYSLAYSYRRAGRLAEAIRRHEQALALRKAKLPAEHPDTIASVGQLGSAYLESQRFADAEAVLRECLALREKKEPDRWQRFQTMSHLGAALAGQQKYAEAERPLVDGFDGLLTRERQIPPPLKGELAAAGARIPPFYEAWGRPTEAARWRQRLAAIAEKLR